VTPAHGGVAFNHTEVLHFSSHHTVYIMDNSECTQLLPWLYIGSKKAAKCRPLLRELNVTHVLNVTPSRTTDPAAGVPNYFEKDRSMTYRRCSVFDTKAENLLGVLPGCVAFLDQGRFYGSVLVHCVQGVSRSASVCAAYLVAHRGMTCDAALAFIKAKRPVVNPNEGFRRQLQQYARAEAARRKARDGGGGGRSGGGGARRPAPAQPHRLSRRRRRPRRAERDSERGRAKSAGRSGGTRTTCRAAGS